MNNKNPDRGGPTDGERSISGRACLPVLIALIGITAILVSSFAAVTAAYGAPVAGGHRGATGVAGYPEESLKATGYAKKYGAGVVEGDVEFTRDGYAVMLHDKTLNRTTNCTGRVADLTFAQLRTCASHAEVPQLLFWLREAKRLGLTVNVEIRNGITAHQVAVFARTIRTEAPANVVVASWYPKPLDDAKAALGSRARYAPIIAATGSPFGYSVAEHAKRYDVIMPDFRWMIVARVQWYHDAGVEVWGWTAKTAEDVRRMRALKLDVIIADDVRKLQ